MVGRTLSFKLNLKNKAIDQRLLNQDVQQESCDPDITSDALSACCT